MINRTKILIEGYCHLPTYDMLVDSLERYCQVVPIDVKCKLSRNITSNDIAWCDVLIVVRGDNPLSAYLSKAAKKSGRKVVLFLDDDLVAVRSEVKSLENKYCYKSLMTVIRTVDYILTCSQYLGEKYKSSFGLNYALLHTDISKEQIVHSPNCSNSNTIKFLYAASKGHTVFFEKLVAPVLNDLYAKYGNKLSLTVIGPDVNLKNIRLKVNKVRSMPYEEYRSFMNNNCFDIGLAPLFDNEMCRSKYFNKYLEYSTNGICGIYSNVIPYTLVVHNRVNGYLSDNTTEEWYNCLCEAIDNLSLSKQYVKNAQESILLDFSLSTIATSVYKELKPVFIHDSNSIFAPNCRNMHFMYINKAVYRNIMKLWDRFEQKGLKYVVVEIYYDIKGVFNRKK